VMAFTFPEFRQPVVIDAERSWTAVFESYDQRNDDVYYVVTVHQTGHESVSFMVQVGLSWAGDDWTGPGFVERLGKEIHQVAATGKTNTSYTGPMAGARTRV
jgi:hypothetical protein